MRFTIILIVVLLINTASNLYAQQYIFQNYHSSTGISHIFPNVPGINGGGTIEIKIEDDNLKVRINGSFTSTSLRIGNILTINSNPILPNLDLGSIHSDYQLVIEDSELKIKSQISSPSKLSSVNFNKSISLSSIMRTRIVEKRALIPLGADINNPSLTANEKEQILKSTKYHDGLGRIIQMNTERKYKNDELIQSIYFDGYGEIQKSSLPVPVASNNKGKFITESHTQVQNFYDQEYGSGEGNYAYHFTDRESKKSERNTFISLPGNILNSSQVNRRLHRTTTNDANEVYRLSISGNAQIICQGYYPEGTLTKTVEMDENKGNKRFRSYSYSDIFGNMICRKIENGSGFDELYSVYDLKGRIKYIIQAEGFARIKGDWSKLNDPVFRNKWMFEYEYNSKDQIIIKRVPGRGLEYSVYDLKNRLVYSQNALQRNKNKWSYYLFDVQDRVIMSGQKAQNHGILSLQSQVKIANQNFPNAIDEERNASQIGYTQRSVQSNQTDIDLIRYFDDYDFNGDGMKDYHFIPDTDNIFPNIQNLNTSPYTLQTGEISYLDSKNGDNITRILFYDLKNRIIQEQKHYNVSGDGFTNITYYKYDFTDKIVSKKTVHRFNEAGMISILEKIKYNQSGNIIESRWKVNNEEEVIVNSLEYDTLEFISRRDIHSIVSNPGYLQSNFYDHDINGNMISINKQDLTMVSSGTTTQSNNRGQGNPLRFSMALDYSTSSSPEFIPNYNGNISRITWKNALSQIPESFNYSYDQKGQVIKAKYGARDNEELTWSKDVDQFTVKDIIYDKNGNIHAVKRYGIGASLNKASSMQLSDNLIYRYQGNQIFSIDDNANSNGIRDFQDYGFKGLENQEYFYDENGNLIEDAPRNISFEYNYSDLLKQVSLGNNTEIDYIYDANGNKIIESIKQGKVSILLRHYGDFFYENGKLKWISTSFGRLVPESVNADFRYEYTISDHLGNPRLRFSDLDKNGILNQSDILEEQNYYPFGMRMPHLNSQIAGIENRKYFNSKEELFLVEDINNDGLREASIDLLDFGARYYEPSIASWRSIDKRADNFQLLSPYSYNKNNPISMIDVNGLAWNPVYTNDNLSGFEWVPEDESFDEDGNLRSGLYRQAIFFTNASSVNNDWGIGTSEAVVYLSDGSIERFDAHTTTSNPDAYPVIPDGLYEAGYGMHNNSYNALRVGDRGTENFYNNRIELGFENPSYSDGRTFAEGINIHKAGVRNFTGVTNRGNPISAGCLLIDRDRWEEFISHFDGNESQYRVGVGVSRHFFEPINNYYIPIYLRAQQQLRLFDEHIDLSSPQSIINR